MNRLLLLCALIFGFTACERHPVSALVHLEHGAGHGAEHGDTHKPSGTHESHQAQAPSSPAEAPKLLH